MSAWPAGNAGVTHVQTLVLAAHGGAGRCGQGWIITTQAIYQHYIVCLQATLIPPNWLARQAATGIGPVEHAVGRAIRALALHARAVKARLLALAKATLQ